MRGLSVRPPLLIIIFLFLFVLGPISIVCKALLLTIGFPQTLFLIYIEMLRCIPARTLSLSLREQLYKSRTK